VGYSPLAGERGETKLSKARWSETEQAKGAQPSIEQKKRGISPPLA